MFGDLPESEKIRLNEEMYKSYVNLFTTAEINEGFHIIPLKTAIDYINDDEFKSYSSGQKYSIMKEICINYSSSVLNFIWLNVNFNKDASEYFQYRIDEFLNNLDENFKKYFTEEELANKKYEKLITRFREIEAKELDHPAFRNEMFGLDNEFPTFKQHIRIIIARSSNYESADIFK